MSHAADLREACDQFDAGLRSFADQEQLLFTVRLIADRLETAARIDDNTQHSVRAALVHRELHPADKAMSGRNQTLDLRRLK